VVCKGFNWKTDLASFEEHQRQEIKIVLNVKGAVLWDVTPCILVEMHWHFRGTYGVVVYCDHAGSRLLWNVRVDIYPDDCWRNFLWNTGTLLPDCMASHPHGQHHERLISYRAYIAFMWYLFCLQILQNSGLQQQQHSGWVKMKDFIIRTNPYTVSFLYPGYLLYQI
jgi:hypothetical protein